MSTLLAAAAPVFLLSLVKPVITAAVLAAWAAIVSRLDSDAGRYYVKRQAFNALHLLCGILGFAAILFLPTFWLGLPVGLLILATSIVLYWRYRHGEGRVPANAHWSLSTDFISDWWHQRRSDSAARAATVHLRTVKGQAIPAPQSGDPESEAFNAFEDILMFAVPRGASNIDLITDAEQTRLEAKIDGVPYPLEPPTPEVTLQMIDYLKQTMGLDVEDRRRRQSGRLVATLEDHGEHTLEITTAGSTRGVKASMILNPDVTAKMPLGLLGFLPKQMDFLEGVLAENRGVILLAVDKHQGGPTTQYALIGHIDPYINSVVSIEPDEQVELEGIDRHVMDSGTPPKDFNDKLGVIIRSDPNVVMLYRIADAASLKQIADAAHDMRFIVPVPAADSTTALATYMKAIGDPKLAADGLSTVIAQRLVRRLCTTCRVPFTPDPAALKKLNLPADRAGTLYRSSGKVLVKERETECPDCMGMGYRGRVAVFEMMPLDDDARTMIAAGEKDKLRSHLRRLGMVYLQEAALAKVVDGITDIKEVQRVLKRK